MHSALQVSLSQKQLKSVLQSSGKLLVAGALVLYHAVAAAVFQPTAAISKCRHCFSPSTSYSPKSALQIYATQSRCLLLQ